METFKSDLSHNDFPITERVSGKTVRKSIFDQILKDHPLFTDDSYLSISELNYYREKYVQQILTDQIGPLTSFEETVLASMKDKTTLTNKIDLEDQEERSFGQRLADQVASFGGSWTFIISFGLFLLTWISVNIVWLSNKGFDPYPFILLNLILSTLAAIQAPVIMMSQNRQEAKDRERAQKDYMVNLKSELEIRMLHEKIDHLVLNQQQDIIELHQKQTSMIKELFKQIPNKQ
jgi:uncharacterized membrane protein